MKLKKIKKYDAGGAVVVDRNYFGSQPFAAGKPKKQRLFANGGGVQPMSNISLSKPYLPNTPIQIGNSMNVIAEQGANKLKKSGVISPQTAFAYRLPQGNPLFAKGGYVGKIKFDDGGNVEASDAISGGISGAATGAAVGSVIPGIGTAIGAGVGFLAGGIGGYFKGKNDYDVEQQKLKNQQLNTNSLMNLPPPAYGSHFANGGLVNPHLIYAMGGHIDSKAEEAREPHQTINVEKNELETKNGRMINDFMNKPKHPINGSMNPQGNTVAQKGNTIIPAHMRTNYMAADLIKRKEIESKLKSDQTKRQQFANRKFAEGGYIGKFDGGGTVDQSLMYTDPAKYAFQVTTPNTKSPFTYQDGYNDPSTTNTQYSDIDYNNLDAPTSKIVPNSDQSANNFDYKKLVPYASNITNAILTTNTPKYANPVLNNYIALNNRLEIQPQLDDISTNAKGTLNAIAGRTNSGSVYRATAGDIYAKEQNERNKVYASAANYKNGITNQQILENSGIDRGNNDTINKYNVMNTLRKMDINKSISQNVDNASSKAQGQQKDQALMDNDTKKALMVYGIFNQNGVLDRAGLEQSWPQLTEAHKKALKDAYPDETKNLK